MRMIKDGMRWDEEERAIFLKRGSCAHVILKFIYRENTQNEVIGSEKHMIIPKILLHVI